jgi:hypothetical protein
VGIEPTTEGLREEMSPFSLVNLDDLVFKYQRDASI